MKSPLPMMLLAGLALAGCADNTPGGKAVQVRHQHFEAIGKASKGITNTLKSDAPDLNAVKQDAATIAGLASQITTWFPAGSGPQDGKRTDAKAEAWTQPAELQLAATRLGDAAAALNAAAGTGNLAQTAAAAKTLAAACKACHTKFKKD